MDVLVLIYLEYLDQPIGVVDCGVSKQGHPGYSHRYQWGNYLKIFDYGIMDLPKGIWSDVPESCRHPGWVGLILEGDWLDKWSEELSGVSIDWQTRHPRDYLLHVLGSSNNWIFAFAVESDDLESKFAST